VLERVGRELRQREREHAGAGAPREAAHSGDDRAEQHARDRRERRQDEGAADEAHHRLAAAAASEDGGCVARHGGRHAGPRCPPAADGQSYQPGRERLGAVAREGRPSPPGAELLKRVPGAGVAVAGPVQVDSVAARDDRGDWYRPEQVTRHHRDDVLHTCPSPPSI
jgi:hypothetical protein